MNIRVMGTTGRRSLMVWVVLFLLAPLVQATVSISYESHGISPTKAWTTLYYLDADYECNNLDPLHSMFLDEINSTVHVNVVVIQDREKEPAFL